MRRDQLGHLLTHGSYQELAGSPAVGQFRFPEGTAVDRQRGATAVEYGLLLAGIVAVIVLAVYLFGGSVRGLFVDSCSTITTQTTGSGVSC